MDITASIIFEFREGNKFADPHHPLLVPYAQTDIIISMGDEGV